MMSGVAQGAEQDGASANGTAQAAVAEHGTVTSALQLGWRLAELYAQVHDFGDPSRDTLLPASGSLKPRDQLDLQLRAAAGDARRAEVPEGAAMLEQLVQRARKAPGSKEAKRRFRGTIRSCHVEINKALWARDEAAGKAYELGNGMSDTYNRIRCSYSADSREGGPERAWENVFDRDRIERLKRLLDDLESRLDSNGVSVVRGHLDLWCDEVPRRIEAAGGPPEERVVRKGLRRQTITWRQLITGDKAPEAYLGSKARGELRGELRKLAWRRCRRWVLPAAGFLLALIVFLPSVLEWYEQSGEMKRVASVGLALAGGLGITGASVLYTVRTRLHQWSALLWEQALVRKVGAETIALDSVLSRPSRARHLTSAAASVRDAVTDRFAQGPATTQPRHGIETT